MFAVENYLPLGGAHYTSDEYIKMVHYLVERLRSHRFVLPPVIEFNQRAPGGTEQETY